MTDLEPRTPLVDRRTLAKGAAWAAPALAAVTVVPVASASKAPKNALQGPFSVGRVTDRRGRKTDYVEQTGGTVYVTDTLATQQILKITLNFGSYPHAYTGVSGTSVGWSQPTPTGPTITYDGKTFQTWSSTYSGTPITCSAGTTTIPASFDWTFDTGSTHTTYCMVQRVVLITPPAAGTTVTWINGDPAT